MTVYTVVKKNSKSVLSMILDGEEEEVKLENEESFSDSFFDEFVILENFRFLDAAASSTKCSSSFIEKSKLTSPETPPPDLV